MCIGLSARSVSLARPPGWESESYGFHGDDGDIYNQQSNGKGYSTPFRAPDVIGCGINFRTKTVFFTKNGSNLGTNSATSTHH